MHQAMGTDSPWNQIIHVFSPLAGWRSDAVRGRWCKREDSDVIWKEKLLVLSNEDEREREQGRGGGGSYRMVLSVQSIKHGPFELQYSSVNQTTSSLILPTHPPLLSLRQPPLPNSCKYATTKIGNSCIWLCSKEGRKKQRCPWILKWGLKRSYWWW
jgi:hypothetical protein